MIAGLLDDDDDGKNLLDATRGLAGAFSNLLKAAQEGGGADSEVSNVANFSCHGIDLVFIFINFH